MLLPNSFSRIFYTLTFFTTFSFLSFVGVKPAVGATLPVPTERVLLTVSGNVVHSNVVSGNGSSQATFDLAMLKQLPQHQLLTTTPWTDGIQSFTGVLLKDLLARATNSHAGIKVLAIDNFSAKISAQEIKDYPIMIAYLRNGKQMKIRHKGPLWVIYPLDQYPQLKQSVYHDRMVWQLDKIQVQ